MNRLPSALDLPSYSERLQLALESVRLGDIGAYDVLLDLIAEARG